ncbi:hypothetical protein IV203_034157 [Nitzschia inconspicua]|uniref:Uncharacterized protein n=1 Tax=Nitzschia inconspicua TaxID=303405 RepID=A0A9K3M356_9STRA|nr:hypothetical protein IV203_034157 [Nitzschia inconspicua]
MHLPSIVLCCCCIGYIFEVSHGFSTCTTTTTTTTPSTHASYVSILRTALDSSYYSDPGEKNEDRRRGSPYKDWNDDPRINVLNLLTQRAIQSFMFLCESVRDPHSGKWMEDFFETKNQLEYHGTGATYCTTQFGGTWDGPLLAMMEQPKDVVVVSAKRRGRGHGGWSKDNPFLEERFVEFNIDIDPVSLTNRILAVREQIAKEWVTDLDVLSSANQRILESYFAHARQAREKKDTELQSTSTSVAFERTAVNILNNHTGFAVAEGSPLRKGNFDLVYNLCTQASVHRLLKQFMDAGDAKEVSYAWLNEFYRDRVADYFDGDQPYGRADDFVEELLRSSPSVIRREDGKMALADPFGLAEQIIATRDEIVSEWKEAMRQVPADHQDGIQRILLNKQMEAWGSSPSGLGGANSGFQ